MRADDLIFGGGLARVAALALALIGAGAVSARAASDLGPAEAPKTSDHLSYLCWSSSLCPMSDQNYRVLKKAVAGDRDAQYLWGLTLLTGDGAPTDRVAGMKWIVLAAEQGVSAAAIFLAHKEQNGESVDMDETKIAAILKKEADTGDVEAMRALAPMMIRGRGTAQDPKGGIDLLRKAAERGSGGVVEYDIAELYLIGTNGLPHDHEEAMKWYALSASRGNVHAMATLGGLWENVPMIDLIKMMETGQIPKRTFEPDITQSYCWRVRAASLDSALAQYELALMTSRHVSDNRGHVIEPNLVQADFWFRLGARDREYDNSQVRGAIEPKMTTAQLDEAKRLVAGWHKLTFEQMKATSINFLNDLARPCPPMP